MGKTLTLLLMDPPLESANTTTAFRLIVAALRKSHTVNVFAYEGAVNLTMRGQQPHANPAHGKSVEEEHHPLTRDIVAGLFAEGEGERLRWINCADITILLTGNAVNYAVCGQQPPVLRFGAAAIEFPPRLDRDLQQAVEAGVKLVLVRDGADVRGIPATPLMPEMEQISREQLADFLNGFDLVWHW
jgi:hypothetical protein